MRIIGIILILATLLIIAIDIYVLVKTINIKGSNECKCVKKVYLNSIIASIIIMILLILSIILLEIIVGESKTTIQEIILTTQFFALFVILPYCSIMMFKMAKQIENDKCDCVDSNFKNLLKYFSIVRLLPIIIIFIVVVTIIIKNKKKQ